MMIPKRLSEITADDILRLVENGRTEDRDLDFKRDLYGAADEDKRELLADISSFANLSGGDLIIGIQDVNGIASAATAVELANPDAEILRLESIIRDGLEPRLLGVQSHSVKMEGERYILLVRVPQSFAAPHRVKYKSWDKFFSHNSRGKYPMDVWELRNAFNQSDRLLEEARTFRDRRIEKIASNGTPVPIGGEGAPCTTSVAVADTWTTASRECCIRERHQRHRDMGLGRTI
jgi:predicted HTH transcriptional regulator